jgi:hypothetical protein
VPDVGFEEAQAVLACLAGTETHGKSSSSSLAPTLIERTPGRGPQGLPRTTLPTPWLDSGYGVAAWLPSGRKGRVQLNSPTHLRPG